MQEFCNGGSLREAVSSGAFSSETLPKRWKPLMKLLMGIAGGMEYVHGKRILHGDLNPSNILLKVRPLLGMDAAVLNACCWGALLPPLLGMCGPRAARMPSLFTTCSAL